ncbi:MAG: hypothetical protein IJ360_01425 [Clostridia bacterium]|nr:hypothetical protein [Clostridia bacterium]
MARPKTKHSKALNCLIEVETYKLLEEFCSDVGQTKTEMVERAIREYVQNHKDEQEKLRK